MVACALTRQASRGRFGGRKTVKPRLALTTLQSVMVVGVPGPIVGELLAVALGEAPAVTVTVGEALAVTVAVGDVVTVAVAVAVTVGAAPSSRNSIVGLPHHFNFASGKLAGSAVAVEPGCEDAKGLEHETSSRAASIALNAR